MNHISQNMDFLKEMTVSVIEASRIRPNENLLEKPGGQVFETSNIPLINSTGITLIRPGGWGCYPSFWIRDFAMSMECGLIPLHEIKQMMLLIASRQNGPQDVIHDNALVPPFAIPDHINLDGSPVFFPGTYSSGKDSGGGIWGDLPPYCDYFYFIESVYWYVSQSLDWEILNQRISGFTLLDRIWKAFHVPQTDPDNYLLLTEDNRRAINFGFVDTVKQTGYLLFSSILRYRSAKMLAEIFKYQRKPDIVSTLQEQIRVMEHYIPLVFGDNSGWLKASTGMSSQHDIWGTCFAVFNGLLRGNKREAALEVIRDGYLSGNTCFRGNVRHVPTNADASEHSAWEQCLAGKNTYQNGAYWGTPSGWYSYALNQISPTLSLRLFQEYIDELV